MSGTLGSAPLQAETHLEITLPRALDRRLPAVMLQYPPLEKLWRNCLAKEVAKIIGGSLITRGFDYQY